MNEVGEASNLAMWQYVVGFLMPLLIAVVQQPKFHSAARALFTALSCIIAGAGTVAFEHGLHFDEHLATGILRVAVTAIAMYHGFWKPTGVAPRIEAATSSDDGHRHG